MDEREWMTSDNVTAMLDWRRYGRPSGIPAWIEPISDRKLRLFACACCRQVWHLLKDDYECNDCFGSGVALAKDACAGKEYSYAAKCLSCKGTGRINRSRSAVEVAERFADGLATEKELRAVRVGAADACANSSSRSGALHLAHMVAENKLNVGLAVLEAAINAGIPPVLQAALLRDVAGNPWRVDHIHIPYHHDWQRNPTVLALARTAYLERERVCGRCEGEKGYLHRPGPQQQWIDCPDCHGTGRIEDGTLDPFRLAVLSDALEEAGCDNEEVLRHLRGEELCPNLCAKVDALTIGRYYMQAGKPSEEGTCELKQVLCRDCVGGWRPLRGPHVRGCWCIDLLLGKS